MSYGPWTMVGERRPDAAVRLLCFPYAGAGAAAFRDWHRGLPGDIELVAVQLPGRENRYGEPRLRRLADLMAPLRQMVCQLDDKPFFFFGHSMGALIAFELARALQRAGAPQPFHVLVSGMRAPQLVRRDEQLYLMQDDELLAKIAGYNGTPKELMDDRELMRFFLPQLRDDFAIVETYEYEHEHGARLACPLTALGGTRDPNVAPAELAAWRGHTGGTFRHRLFEGDHFFLHPCKQAVLALLASTAADTLAGRFADTLTDTLTDIESA